MTVYHVGIYSASFGRVFTITLGSPKTDEQAWTRAREMLRPDETIEYVSRVTVR